MGMRLRCAAIAGSLLALAHGVHAQAAPTATPEPAPSAALLGAVEVVDHDVPDGIATCPDVAALQTRIAALRDRSGGSANVRGLRIHLATADGRREARLQVAEANGVRTLELASLSCEQALEAISVAAVMLLEDSAREQPLPPAAEAAPATPAPPPAPPPPPPAAAAPPARPPPPVRVEAREEPLPDPGFWLNGSGDATWGIVQDFGFGATLGAEVTSGLASFGLRGAATFPLDQSFGPDFDFHSELLGIEPNICVRSRPVFGDVRFRGCALLMIGQLRVATSNQDGSDEVTLSYFAGGLGLGFDGPLTERRLGLTFAFEALAPFARDEFARSDTDEVELRTPLIALRVLLGLRFRLN